MQAGEAVTSSLLAYGHDPSRHRDPHRFNIEWADATRLAFGVGGHSCADVSLGAEAQPAILLLFEHFPRIWLHPWHAIEPKPVRVLNGLKAL